MDIVQAIKSHKDVVYVLSMIRLFWLTKSRNEPMFFSGNRLAVVLEAVPEEPTSPLLSFQVRTSNHLVCVGYYYVHTQSPLSLNSIEVRVFARVGGVPTTRVLL